MNSMSVRELMDKPRKLAFHNLCTYLKPPPGTRELLGLGPKFCVRPPYLNHTVDETFKQLQKDVRNKFYWAKGDTEEDVPEEKGDYEKKFYINSKWKPPTLKGHEFIVESKMVDFRDTTLAQMKLMNENVQE